MTRRVAARTYRESVAGVDLAVVTLTDAAAVATDCARRTLAATGDGVLADLFAGIHDVLAPGGECRLVHHRALDLDAHLQPYDAVATVARCDEHVVRTARD